MSLDSTGVASVENLTVRYGTKTILSDFSLVIPDGCTGLLGPNGAGKTTLLKTLLGFVSPAGGRGQVLGLDVATQGMLIRQKIGLMPEQDCHIPGMNAVTFVAYAGELAGMPASQAMRRAHEVLEYCGLGEARYRNVETYSTGMKQRIKLAQALVHGPKLLFLDEPTNGLDPVGIAEIRTLIIELASRGKTIIMASHLLDEVEKVCTHAVILKYGKQITYGPVSEILSNDDFVEISTHELEKATLILKQFEGVRKMTREGDLLILDFSAGKADLAAINTFCFQNGVVLSHLQFRKKSLEKRFLELTH